MPMNTCHRAIFKDVVKGDIIYIGANRYEVLEVTFIKLTKINMMLKDVNGKITKKNKFIDTEVIIVNKEMI